MSTVCRHELGLGVVGSSAVRSEGRDIDVLDLGSGRPVAVDDGSAPVWLARGEGGPDRRLFGGGAEVVSSGGVEEEGTRCPPEPSGIGGVFGLL